MAVSPAIQKHFDTTTAYLDRIDKAIDGIKVDEDAQLALIKQLQSTQGVLSAEDQGLLDQIEALGDVKAKKVEDLDAMNPPPPPPTA